MAKELIYTIEFQGADEQIQKLAKIEQTQKALRSEVKELTKGTKELSQEEAERAERLKVSIAENSKLSRQLKKDIADQNAAVKDGARTLASMRAELSRMNSRQKETPIYTKQWYEQRDAIKQLSDEIKEAEFSMGNYTRNVGNYAEAADIASMSVNEMRKEIRLLRDMPVAGKSAEEVAALNKRIGELNDSMLKLRQEQEANGMDAFQAYAGAMQAATSAAQILGGTLNILGVESKVFEGLQKNIMELIGISQALATIEQLWYKRVLQRTAALIKAKIATVQDTVAKQANTISTAAATKAEAARAVMLGKGSIATKAAAAATWLWNAALAANPVVLIVAGVAALATGVVALTKALRRNKEQTDELRQSNEALLAVYEQKQGAMDYELRYLKAIGASQEEIIAKTKEMLLAEVALADQLAANAETQEERTAAIERGRKAWQEYNLLMAEQIRKEREAKEVKQDLTEQTRAHADEQKRLNEEYFKYIASLDDQKTFIQEIDKFISDMLARNEARREAAGRVLNLPTAEEADVALTAVEQRMLAQARYERELFQQTYEGRRQALDDLLAQNLISETEHADKVAVLRRQKNDEWVQSGMDAVNTLRKGFAENAKAQRALSIFEQALQIKKTIGDITAGFAKNASAAPFPANIPLIAEFAAQVAGLVASIRSLRTPAPPQVAPIQYAKGGIVGGKSHAQGGTKYYGEDGNVVELERGELFTVVNKHDTPMLSMLSDVNSRNGRKFAQGGIVNNTAGMPGVGMMEALMKGIYSIPVVLVESDVTEAQAKARKIKTAGDL